MLLSLAKWLFFKTLASFLRLAKNYTLLPKKIFFHPLDVYENHLKIKQPRLRQKAAQQFSYKRYRMSVCLGNQEMVYIVPFL
jgi:hypothetical protein